MSSHEESDKPEIIMPSPPPPPLQSPLPQKPQSSEEGDNGNGGEGVIMLKSSWNAHEVHVKTQGIT